MLANVNAGNDLAELIRNEGVGHVCESNQPGELMALAEALLHQIDADADVPARCRQLFAREFSAAQAVQQIVAALDLDTR